MFAGTVIATNTFRQTVRERLFYNLIVFGVGMVMLGTTVGQLTYGKTDRVIRSIGLSGVSLSLDLMGLLLGVALVHQEIERKTLFVLLTRPVRRYQYLLGRYLGLMMTLAVSLLGLSAAMVIALLLSRGSPTGADLVALGMTYVEACLIAGVGMTLSCFTTPTLAAGMGIGIWITGASVDDFVGLTQKADAFTKSIARIAFYVFPALSRFNFRDAAVYATAIDPIHVAHSVIYGAAYIFLLLTMSTIILNRREMI